MSPVRRGEEAGRGRGRVASAAREGELASPFSVDVWLSEL
jgi:hypothetical protein